MKNLFCVFNRKVTFLCFLFISNFSFAQTITTFAGCDSTGYSGDGGPATTADLGEITGVAVDGLGNVYIADPGYSRVRIIRSSGLIDVFAGNGFAFYLGDGGPATSAELINPLAVAVSNSENVYIADESADMVRMVNPNDTISRFAGNGSPFGYSGDGGPATAAELRWPTGVAVDTSGNVYIADQFNNRIRKVNTFGIISTIAGNDNFSGYSGDGGPSTSAEINVPTGVGVDISGNVYFADCNNERIREINLEGIINTIAGNGTAGFSGDGGAATLAELSGPIYVEVDNYSNVYITDVTNNRIRMVKASGTISTLVGNGIAGFSGDGGPASSAEINAPHGIALDASGNLYIADQDNWRIRKVSNITGIVEIKEKNNVLVYPNPNNGIFNVKLETTANSSKQNIGDYFYLYDAMGQLIDKDILTNAITTISLQDETEGIYYYRIVDISQKEIKADKLLIIR